MQEFLMKFQTEAPMAPYLGSSSKDLLKNTMGPFFEKWSVEKSHYIQEIE